MEAIMPIKSKKQWKYFAMHHPELLHKWQKEAPVDYKKLPEKKESYVLVEENVEYLIEGWKFKDNKNNTYYTSLSPKEVMKLQELDVQKENGEYVNIMTKNINFWSFTQE
jgi:hypothetical protein